MKAKIGDYIKYKEYDCYHELFVYQGKLESFYLEFDEEKAEGWIYGEGESLIPNAIEISGLKSAIRDDNYAIRDCDLFFEEESVSCNIFAVLDVQATPFEGVVFQRVEQMDPMRQAWEARINRLEAGYLDF